MTRRRLRRAGPSTPGGARLDPACRPDRSRLPAARRRARSRAASGGTAPGRAPPPHGRRRRVGRAPPPRRGETESRRTTMETPRTAHPPEVGPGWAPEEAARSVAGARSPARSSARWPPCAGSRPQALRRRPTPNGPILRPGAAASAARGRRCRAAGVPAPRLPRPGRTPRRSAPVPAPPAMSFRWTRRSRPDTSSERLPRWSRSGQALAAASAPHRRTSASMSSGMTGLLTRSRPTLARDAPDHLELVAVGV